MNDADDIVSAGQASQFKFGLPRMDYIQEKMKWKITRNGVCLYGWSEKHTESQNGECPKRSPRNARFESDSLYSTFRHGISLSRFISC